MFNNLRRWEFGECLNINVIVQGVRKMFAFLTSKLVLIYFWVGRLLRTDSSSRNFWLQIELSRNQEKCSLLIDRHVERI